MKKTLALTLALALVLSLGVMAPAMADKANDTLIYGIEGDPGNDINTITTSGRFDLMTELGYRPTNKYLPPRPGRRGDGRPDVALEDASPNGGFLGWLDKVLS